jgi:cytochrome c6
MKRMISAVLMLGLAVPVMAADLSSNADFKAKCAACHGANGEGKPAMKTVPMKEAASKSEAELTKIITDGQNKMPAYKGKLTEAQIKDLVAAIKAQK